MNKQELIYKLERLLEMPSEMEGYDFDYGHDFGIRRAIVLVKQLDEPARQPEPKPLEIEKPVVPQYVADWYEEHKDDFEGGVYELCTQCYEDEAQLSDELYDWFVSSENKPIETLVKMKLFGYEVKKEKLYRAKNKQTGEYLCYCFEFFHDKNSSSENQRFTAEEKRWKELGYWGNDLYVFEEAEGEDE